MKKSLSLVYLFGLIIIHSFAQNEAQKEINEQVWKPFIDSYNQFDAETFNNLHTNDIIRSGPWGLRIGDEYKKSNQERFDRLNKTEKKIEISLRFEHRNVSASGDIAYEVGYYRVNYEDGNTSYGRFHVVLRKIENVWKIAQDWDTNKVLEHKIGEKDFLKAKPLSSN